MVCLCTSDTMFFYNNAYIRQPTQFLCGHTPIHFKMYTSYQGKCLYVVYVHNSAPRPHRVKMLPTPILSFIHDQRPV
ncbi:hypothetical protein HYC85_003279 [Camellia sinensis]|uniref:Uncharacterized protein n=1 Tax=Camellia sinensis TaxID=4442 RepID=A0A7J7IAV0_CAMSI|nr:hypothetical protein HYC85_003279 [Camellia sinensis]